jgi:hypothetical protein
MLGSLPPSCLAGRVATVLRRRPSHKQDHPAKCNTASRAKPPAPVIIADTYQIPSNKSEYHRITVKIDHEGLDASMSLLSDASLLSLPSELLLHILSFLDVPELLNTSRVRPTHPHLLPLLAFKSNQFSSPRQPATSDTCASTPSSTPPASSAPPSPSPDPSPAGPLSPSSSCTEST